MNLCSRCSGELPAFAVFCPHGAQAHEPNFEILINLTLDGRYRIYRRLGQTGMLGNALSQKALVLLEAGDHKASMPLLRRAKDGHARRKRSSTR